MKKWNFSMKALQMYYRNPIRTALWQSRDADLLSVTILMIEARVLAWLLGEEWRLQVFETHENIREASASAMFHVPIEEITKTSPLRQKGKSANFGIGMQLEH